MKYFTELSAFAAGIILASVLTGSTPTIDKPFDGSRSASTRIAAVSSQGNGSLGEVNVKVGPGEGSVLLNADPFIETDTQVSAKTARKVAQEFTGETLANMDTTYRFRIDGEYVGGPSAGTAMALATIAAIENRSIPENIAVTGTIREDGTVGRVGGILEKAEAAGRNDLEKFYVPQGQSNITYYTKTLERRVLYPGLYTTDTGYEEKTFSVNNYTQKRYNMSTEEVKDIQELYTEVIGN